jgi:hypothetical protein
MFLTKYFGQSAASSDTSDIPGYCKNAMFSPGCPPRPKPKAEIDGDGGSGEHHWNARRKGVAMV